MEGKEKIGLVLRQIQVPESRIVRRHCLCHRYLFQPVFTQISTSMLTSAAVTYSLSPTQDQLL